MIEKCIQSIIFRSAARVFVFFVFVPSFCDSNSIISRILLFMSNIVFDLLPQGFKYLRYIEIIFSTTFQEFNPIFSGKSFPLFFANLALVFANISLIANNNFGDTIWLAFDYLFNPTLKAGKSFTIINCIH